MEDFVPFLLAKKLEEKGFQIEFKYALGYYDTRGQFMTAADHWFLEYWTIAPTISQVLKWLREEKKLHISIEYGYEEIPVWDFEIRLIGNYGRWWTDETYSSYELAAISGIEYCLDNLI